MRADVGECKEIEEERKMNLLVSEDGGRVGVWIRWWIRMHCICPGWCVDMDGHGGHG